MREQVLAGSTASDAARARRRRRARGAARRARAHRSALDRARSGDRRRSRRPRARRAADLAGGRARAARALGATGRAPGDPPGDRPAAAGRPAPGGLLRAHGRALGPRGRRRAHRPAAPHPRDARAADRRAPADREPRAEGALRRRAPRAPARRRVAAALRGVRRPLHGRSAGRVAARRDPSGRNPRGRRGVEACRFRRRARRGRGARTPASRPCATSTFSGWNARPARSSARGPRAARCAPRATTPSSLTARVPGGRGPRRWSRLRSRRPSSRLCRLPRITARGFEAPSGPTDSTSRIAPVTRSAARPSGRHVTRSWTGRPRRLMAESSRSVRSSRPASTERSALPTPSIGRPMSSAHRCWPRASSGRTPHSSADPAFHTWTVWSPSTTITDRLMLLEDRARGSR